MRGLAWSTICGSPDVVESLDDELLSIINACIPQVTVRVRNKMTGFGLMMNVVGCLMLSTLLILVGLVFGLDSSGKLFWMHNVQLKLVMRLLNDVLLRRAMVN